MSGIFSFFTAFFAKIASFSQWILLCVKQIFVDVWNVFTDLFCWFFESILSIAVLALNSISIPFNPQSYYNLIPPEAANMLGYVGVPQAIGIIVTGLILRFTLQTIPFVRWGS